MATPDCDVLVVGAGAAGLGAASCVSAAGLDTIVLEAKERVGGRAFTDERVLGYPFDYGCHWFHSASHNPLAQLAEHAGYPLASPPVPGWVSIDGRRASHLSTSASWRTDAEAHIDAISRFGAHGLNLAASSFVRPQGRWADAFSGWFAMLNGTGPENVCALDHSRYDDTGENWVTPRGYGAFIAECFAPLDVRLGCAVRRIDLHDTGVKVTGDALSYKARAVVVTVSTAVLVQGALAITPDLDLTKRAALAALPLGYAEKVGFPLPENLPFPANGEPETQNLLSVLERSVVSFQIRPQGLPIVSAYFGGWQAAALARQGAHALIKEAGRHFVAATGCQLDDRFATASAWTIDPHVRGASSAARPLTATRQFEPRKVLSEPVEGRLFFAGEATSLDAYSTAHGAYLSGQRAASEVLNSLP